MKKLGLLHKGDEGVADTFRGAAVNLPQLSQPRFTFRQHDHGLLMAFANERVHFPIPNPLTLFNNLRPLFNTFTIGQFSPAVMVAVALLAFLLTAQVIVQITTGMFIAQNLLIYPLMADLDIIVPQQPARYRFWAPIQADFGFDQRPGYVLDPVLSLLAPSHRHVERLLGSIATLFLIAFQLPTDGRFVHSNEIGNLRLTMSHFLQRINLASLFLGKLGVVPHKCPFDLAVRESTYPTSAYLLPPSKLHFEVESALYKQNLC